MLPPVPRISPRLCAKLQALADSPSSAIDRTFAMLFDLSPYLLDYFDAMTQHIAQAHLAEQYQEARWRSALLHQLYGIVFHTPDDARRFRDTVRALGLDDTLPRFANASCCGCHARAANRSRATIRPSPFAPPRSRVPSPACAASASTS